MTITLPNKPVTYSKTPTKKSIFAAALTKHQHAQIWKHLTKDRQTARFKASFVIGRGCTSLEKLAN